MESYNAFVIITKDEMDYNHLCEVLGVETMQSYKNSNTGKTHVISADKFYKQWNKSK